MSLDLAALRREFPRLDEGPLYLNTGSSGMKPAAVFAAIAEYEADAARLGPSGRAFDRKLREVLAETRRLAASLVGAEEAECALVTSTSHALSIALQAFGLGPGERIAVARQEYISGGLAARLAAARGAREPLLFDHRPDGSFDIDAYRRAVAQPGVRIALLSHVNYNTGELLPAAELCAFARAHGVVSVVDGAQAAGMIPVDVRSLGCDVYLYPAHKWLGSVEGAGAILVRRELVDSLLPLEIGWASVASYTPGGPLALHPDARRFECANPPLPSLYAFRAALRRTLGLGVENVARRIGALSARFFAGAEGIRGLALYTPPAARGVTGLAAFSTAGESPEATLARLEAAGMILRTIPFPPCVRASFPAHIAEEEVDRLLAALQREPVGSS